MNDPVASLPAVDRVTLRNGATAEAAKVALPGPLRGAFATVQELQVMDKDGKPTKWFVRPVVDYDMQIIQELGLQDLEGGGRMAEKSCMLCYLFTHPVQQVRRLLRMSVDAFPEAATETFFDNVENRALIEPIGKLIAQQHERYASTRLHYAAKEAKDGEENFSQGSEGRKTG